ncbi:MAG: hypothetical protein IH600_02905 [Bacteroidetes bacterium]|nr:hypothetical protein [Bacteroidota bacterium]
MRWMIILFLLLCTGGEAQAQNDIFFSVNMEDALDWELFTPSKGDRVILRGTFSGWEGDRFELRDDDGDGTYKGEFTLHGEAGSSAEYKYLVLKSDGSVFWEWQPEPANQPFGNRRLLLTGNPQNVPKGNFIIDRYDLAAVGMPVMFPVHELRADFAQLRQALETKHCCLYTHTGKPVLDALFERQGALLDKPMQPFEFYRVIAPISAAVGCGHTSLWMSEAYWTYAGDALFPLRIRVMDGDPVVVGYYGSDQDVPIGSIVLEINGRSMREVINELADLYTADAFNHNFRVVQVERRFPMLYARTYGFPTAYSVKYALPGRKTSANAVLRSTDIDQVRAKIFVAPQLLFDIRENDRAAVLGITSFSYYDRVPMFEAFLDSCFRVILGRGIHKLVLDLRGNDGGDPFCAAALFSHLARHPVPYFSQKYGKYAELADPVPVSQLQYRDSLIVLIDGSNFSTAAHLCALLKSHGIGIMIGSETGGTYVCNAAAHELHLSHTRLLQLIPTESFATAVSGMNPKTGVVPDYAVSQKYKDFLDGKDTVLDYALNLRPTSVR